MQDLFTRSFHVGWGSMDFNAHMRNTSYLDLSGDVRMMFFQEHGFTIREFENLKIGPVIRRDELDYFRELRLLETVNITLSLAGVSPDASRFMLRNEFFKEDGSLVARVTSTVGWLDQVARKLVIPPKRLADLCDYLVKTSDFQELSATNSQRDTMESGAFGPAKKTSRENR